MELLGSRQRGLGAGARGAPAAGRRACVVAHGLRKAKQTEVVVETADARQVQAAPAPTPVSTAANGFVPAVFGGVVATAAFMLFNSRKGADATSDLSSTHNLVRLTTQLQQQVSQMEGSLARAADLGGAAAAQLNGRADSHSAHLPSEEEIRSLFHLWNNALASLIPEAVSDLYANDAVLLPTVSNKVRTDHAGVVDYFRDYMKLKPQAEINESYVAVLQPDLASHYGIYTLSLTEEDGTVKKFPAHFSFTYRKEGARWLITSQHSSALPDEAEEGEIRDLFAVWTAALSSGDASRVVPLYAKDAVLLPTGSNRLRTDAEGVRQFYEAFVLRRPRVVLNESHVQSMGPNLAAHHGVYTITLNRAGDVGGAQAESFKERFSMTYRREGSRWLVIEHHSSLLPDPSSPGSAQTPTLVPAVSEPYATASSSAVLAAAVAATTPETVMRDPVYTSAMLSAPFMSPQAVEVEVPAITEQDVRGLFDQWNNALATLDPYKVADLYTKDAMLLPAHSPEVLADYAAIVGYYSDLLPKMPWAVVNESQVTGVHHGMASHHGVFTLSYRTFVEQEHMRFSFTYRFVGGRWLIMQHTMAMVKNSGEAWDSPGAESQGGSGGSGKGEGAEGEWTW